MKSLLKKIRYALSTILPNHPVFNYIIAVPVFVRGNARFPRSLDTANATINDFIFHRMIRNDWTVLERACVDKEYAKIVAAGIVKEIGISTTKAILRINSATSVDEVVLWASPYFGEKLVLKPTHSAGKVIFLHRGVSREMIADFLDHSKKNFFHLARETQYKDLELKLIIEQNISKNSYPLNDYKFFCSYGVVHYCQVDVDRFVDHKRAVCCIPDFGVSAVKYGHEVPESVEPPKNLQRMIEVATALSMKFEFVRVDLYDTDDGVYFGELTFSPCAGSDPFSDEDFAIDFLRKVRRARNHHV